MSNDANETLRKIRDVIPMDFLMANDTPGVTGPTDNLDLVGAVRMMVDHARKLEARLKEPRNGAASS